MCLAGKKAPELLGTRRIPLKDVFQAKKDFPLVLSTADGSIAKVGTRVGGQGGYTEAVVGLALGLGEG